MVYLNAALLTAGGILSLPFFSLFQWARLDRGFLFDLDP